MRSILAVFMVLFLGVTVLGLGTDGFQAFTAEGARRLAVRENPLSLPAVSLRNSSGTVFRLQDYKGKLVLVTFIYTRCATVCTALGDSFQRIRDSLPSEILGEEVVLLSISFDAEHDNIPQLAAFAVWMEADGRNWCFSRVDNPEELKMLLDVFGIIVIPDEFGGFTHNAAIHLVDRQSRLARIFDYDAVEEVLEELWKRIEGGE